MYQYPQGNAQHLNLDWFLKRWEEFRAEWVNAEANIDHALDAEIARVDAAMANLYAARDAAIAAKDDAVIAKNAAAGSAAAAYGSQTSAASSAAAAMTNALKSEGHAVGEQNGNAVSSGSTYYQNNSKYYANQAAGAVTDAQQEVANAHTEAENAAASAQHAQDLVDTLPSDYSDLLNQVGNQIEGEGTELTGAVVSFDDGVEGVPVRGLTVNIDPVQSGSGVPAPDNIRPITGWTECNVTRCGYNRFNIDDMIAQTHYNTSGVLETQSYRCSTPLIPIEGTLALKWTSSLPLPVNAIVCQFDENKKFLDRSIPTATNNGFVLSLQETTKYVGISFYPAAGNANGTMSDILVAEGSNNAYVAYRGTTYTIEFPAGVGTVYGGTLEKNGTDNWTLSVNKMKFVIDGAENGARVTYKYGDKQTYNLSVPDATGLLVKTQGDSYTIGAIGDIVPNISDNDAYTGDVSGFSTSVNGNFYKLCVKSATATTVTEMNQWLANNPITIVAPIDTPIVYNLTDTEALTLIGDSNNIWADTGDVTVTYGAYLSVLSDGIQTKLNKTNVAPVLSDMVADANLAVNDLRMVNNKLYIVTAAVSSGAALVEGINVTETTIGALLTGLLNA